MKIGLYHVDGKYNLALMKISAWHKARNDIVEWYSPLLKNSYDKIYASRIFNFSDKGYLDSSIMEIGGSGCDLEKKLPHEIEHIYPDYSLYHLDFALGFITRGCIRNCPFCIVPQKEGLIHKNADLTEFTRNQEKVILLDNNFLAYHDHLNELQILIDSKKIMDFNQGLDIRLINKKNAALLREMKTLNGNYRFAFDDPKLKTIIEKKTTILNEAGIPFSKMRFYVLIGFNTSKKEDLMRINYIRDKGMRMFCMPYDKKDPYQKDFARWINRFFYRYESFKDYLAGVRK